MKRLILLLSLLGVTSNGGGQAMNKLPYLTGYYAKTSSLEYAIDVDYSQEVKNDFKAHVLKYKPKATFTETQVTSTDYQEGKRVFMRNDKFNGNAGFTFFAGESAVDISTRTQIYTSAVVVCADITNVLIHEDMHCDGMAHECSNYRWIKYKGVWRKEQAYEYGNLVAGGLMSYGGKSFSPVDDWDVRNVNGLITQKARISGTITIDGEPLKGANLIFISQTKTFKPSERVLAQRFSTIVDILGDGDGSFDIELPPDQYKVMVVPIGDYERETHGVWRLDDSQIEDITEPLILNRRRTRLVATPSTEGVLELKNGQDVTVSWRI